MHERIYIFKGKQITIITLPADGLSPKDAESEAAPSDRPQII